MIFNIMPMAGSDPWEIAAYRVYSNRTLPTITGDNPYTVAAVSSNTGIQFTFDGVNTATVKVTAVQKGLSVSCYKNGTYAEMVMSDASADNATASKTITIGSSVKTLEFTSSNVYSGYSYNFIIEITAYT